ncbi:hypothetical protein Tco_1147728 [Tanacetum coccineum]
MALPNWKDKDWSKVVITDEILEYVIDKYRRNLKENDEIVDIILEDLWQKTYNEPEVAKVIVISTSNEDLSSDEEIVLMVDMPFSLMKNNHKLLQLQDVT